MRRTTLVLNSIVVAFFVCFSAYTFFARQHLESLARDFVTEKTLNYSQSIVEVADEALDSPLIKKFLSDDQESTIRDEIADYRDDPTAYIADLTRQRVREAPQADENPLMGKVASIKAKIRTYYDNTLDALISDLRIFSFTNLIAGVIGWGLAYRSSSVIRRPVVWFAFLIFASVFYCSYLYVDELTFFRILFRTHMGWSYPAFLCVVLIGLYLDYGRHGNAVDQDEAPREPALGREDERATGALMGDR